uniref:Sushi domain-containing protein n=1 Tax=Seriola dumerili TaxID=41447 RepID=A0A3B4V712_SERDU
YAILFYVVFSLFLPYYTIGCDVPQTTSNSKATLADKYITQTSFASGERVYYMCNVGYIRARGSRYRMCKDGEWTRLFLKCRPKPCGSAGEILNGQFIYSGVVFGHTATAVCDEGYSLVGRATRNCMPAGWDGRVPVCEVMVCEEPEVTNAEMIGIQETYTYKAVLRYRCRVGTLIGQMDISNPDIFTFYFLVMNRIKMYAFWMGAYNDRYQYRDTISIACKPGYTMIGPSIITCENDGRWSPSLPKCRRKVRCFPNVVSRAKLILACCRHSGINVHVCREVTRNCSNSKDTVCLRLFRDRVTVT